MSSIQKATHDGTLAIGKVNLPCAVTEDGTRVISETRFMSQLGMYRSGALSVRRDEADDSGARTPLYLAFKNIKPFVDAHLDDVHMAPLKYRTKTGNIAHGIRAEVIPKICEIWLDARAAGVLGPRQVKIAANAEILMRGLAHVGIIALVDEATGYQEVRDKLALQKILEKYLKDYRGKWAKTFPDEFYEHLFRLKGWQYRPLTIRRPAVVGHWTNDIVYSRLAPGVLRELRKRNPMNKSTGRRSSKHHQWLTDDYGQPELRTHLSNVVFLMKAAPNWGQFYRMLQRAAPKYGDTIELSLDDVSDA